MHFVQESIKRRGMSFHLNVENLILTIDRLGRASTKSSTCVQRSSTMPHFFMTRFVPIYLGLCCLFRAPNSLAQTMMITSIYEIYVFTIWHKSILFYILKGFNYDNILKDHHLEF